MEKGKLAGFWQHPFYYPSLTFVLPPVSPSPQKAGFLQNVAEPSLDDPRTKPEQTHSKTGAL